MEHIAAILLLVGCSGDMKDCQELPAPTAIYETAEECTADLGTAMSSVAGSRPKILARCVSVDPSMEEEEASLVWDIDGQGNLYAAVEIADPDVMLADADEPTISAQR